MSKKRRVFDVDMPDEAPQDAPQAKTFPEGKVGKPQVRSLRRGPMATAINENADSLRQRQETEAAIRQENDALAHEHVRLKRQGLITDLVPVDQVEVYKLTRDRAKGADFDLQELKNSIRDLGLSNPIRLEPRTDGSYELIQGYRRLSAFKELLEETGDTDSYSKIPASIIAAGEGLETLYRQMVDENLVRTDISFAEMANLAIHYAMDPAIECSNADEAVAILFQSAGSQKRSYIRNFVEMMEVLGDDIQFPGDIPRALGLALRKRLREVDGLGGLINSELRARADNRSVAEELEVLRKYAGQGEDSETDVMSAKLTSKTADRKAKTTFQISRPEGPAKCTASSGRLEVRLPKDFSTIDRRKLEAAVQSLLDQLS